MADFVNISKPLELAVAMGAVHTVHRQRWLRVENIHVVNTGNTSQTLRAPA